MGGGACHSALRLVGQEPEPSQATDMALASGMLLPGQGLRGRLPMVLTLSQIANAVKYGVVLFVLRPLLYCSLVST